MLHRSDEEQLTWATENNRVIFSFNARDFYQLHTILLERGLSHAGMIPAPQQRYGIGDLMRGVLKLINTKSLEEMQGQIEFLSDWISWVRWVDAHLVSIISHIHLGILLCRLPQLVDRVRIEEFQ
jgi:hypothetical protein